MTRRFPKEFIDELLSRIDITELIDRRLTLKKSGANFTACCPFHTEKTASFSVSAVKQFYHCFGCGAHGNALSFLMAYDRLEFVEAVEELASQLGVPLPEELTPSLPGPPPSLYALLEKATHYYQSQLSKSELACAYLKSRGLDQPIIQRFAIGFAPDGWSNLYNYLGHSTETQQQLLLTGMISKSTGGKLYDHFRERIIFPIKDSRGRIIAFGGRTLSNQQPKYLNSPETALFHKGSELYGLYEMRNSSPASLPYILVVEGYMDVISLHQAGITAAVATLGTATSQKHLQRLFRYTTEIIFCFDGDAAGKKAAWRALETSLGVIHEGLQIRFMFLPAKEDPDSLVRQQGAEHFRLQITQAVLLTDFFFNKLSAEINLNSVDGKAKLVKTAAVLINKIRNGVLQQLMMEKLAALTGMSIETLTNYCVDERTPAINPVKTQTPATRLTSKTTSQLLPPVQLAIALLLHYPQLTQQINSLESLIEVTIPGTKTLKNLFTALKSNPSHSIGSLLEQWRGTKTADRLAKLATCELLIPANGAAAEFTQAIHRLQSLEKEQQIQQLHSKANAAGLSRQEKEKLLHLLKGRH